MTVKLISIADALTGNGEHCHSDMNRVIVNGVITVREGNLTGDRGGAILRK